MQINTYTKMVQGEITTYKLSSSALISVISKYTEGLFQHLSKS